MMKRFALALSFAVAAGGCGGKDDPAPAGKASFDVLPTSLAFGGVTLGTTAEQTFEVVNDGTAPVSVQLAANESVFDVEPKTAEIAEGAKATFTVAFTPAGLDEITGKIVISSEAGEREVALSGSGIEATVVIEPRGTIDFGEFVRDRDDTTKDNRTPARKPLAIANAGSDTFEVLSIEIVESAGGAFTGDFSKLLGTYAKAERRTVDVRFDPTVLGALEGALRITTDLPANPEITLPLRGTGVAPIMQVCTRFDDEPEDAAVCTPEVPEQVPVGGPFPGWNFGNLPDLQVRGGVVTVTNTGNVPLEFTAITYNPSSPDIRFWSNAARTEPADLSKRPIICPEGMTDDKCTHRGLMTLWVDYLPRGSACCHDGVQECIDLAPQGDCTKAANADQGQLNLLSNDPVWGGVTLVGEGRSNIAVAQIGNFDTRLWTNDTFRLEISNIGGAPLTVNGIMLVDPAVTDCEGGPPCDCAVTATAVCTAYRVDPGTRFPFTLQPDGRRDVFFEFVAEELGPKRIQVWWNTTDSTFRDVISNVLVTGQGPRPVED